MSDKALNRTSPKNYQFEIPEKARILENSIIPKQAVFIEVWASTEQLAREQLSQCPGFTGSEPFYNQQGERP